MSKKAYHSYKCLACGKGHQTKAERGLCYIVHSPPERHGGFHQQTVNIAFAAMREIRQLRQKAHRPTVGAE